MSDIKVTMDIKDVLDGTVKLLKLNAQQESSYRALNAVLLQLGQGRDAEVVSTDTQINANQRLLQSIRTLDDGTKKVVTSIRATNDAILRQRQSTQAALAAPNLTALNKAISSSAQQYSQAESAKIEKIKTAIAKLDTVEVSPANIKNFIDTIRSGNTIQATGTLAKLRDEIQKLVNVENLAKSRISSGSTTGLNQQQQQQLRSQAQGRQSSFQQGYQSYFVENAARQVGADLSQLSPAQEAQIRRAGFNISKILRDNISADQSKVFGRPQLQGVLDQLIKGNQLSFVNNPALQRSTNELAKLVSLLQRVGQLQRSSGSSQAAEARTQSIQGTIDKILRPLQSQLRSLDPSLQIDPQKLEQITRRIGELGQAANLSQRQVAQMFQRFSQGASTPQDQSNRGLITQFGKLTNLRDKAIDKGTSFSGAALPPKQDDIKRAEDYTNIWQKLRNSFDYFLLYKGFNVLNQQLAEGFTNARQYQTQVSLIRTISQDAQLTFREWEAGIRGVSDALGSDFADTANAAYDAVSNQITKGRSTFDFVKSAGELARTTNSTLQDSTNLLSSAINAYGFSTDDAEKLSAKFFKTIDLGRIKAGDLSNTFGRVAFSGRELGVEFDEILALLSAMTRAGVTTDDAITFLTNGMNKLTNPTEKMTKLLAEWGYATPKAAVATETFTGLMGRFIESVKSGRVEITDLFNEIRGEKFADFFAGSGQKNVLSDLNQIRNESGKTYDAAKNIRGDFDADKLNKDLNTFKNAIATSLGNSLVRLGKDLFDLAGGADKLADRFKNAVPYIVGLGVAFTTYKAALFTGGLVMDILRASQLALNGVQATGAVVTGQATVAQLTQAAAVRTTAAATAGATSATVANTAAMGASRAIYLLHPAAALASALAGLYVAWEANSYKAANFTESLQGMKDQLEQVRKKAAEIKEQTIFDKQAKDLDKINEKYKSFGKETATALGIANRELDNIREKGTRTSTALKDGFGRYTDFVKNRISEITTEYNKFDERLKASNKSMLSLKDQSDQLLGGTEDKYASQQDFGRQKEALIDGRMQKLEARIAVLYKPDDNGRISDENVQEARQLATEYQNLLHQKHTIINDRSVEQFKLGLQSGRVPPPPEVHDEFGRRLNPEIGIDKTAESQGYQSFQARQAAREKAYQAQQKKNRPILEDQQLNLKELLRKAQSVADDLEKFSVFDKAGEVLPEFKDKVTGKIDFDKVRAKLDDLKTRFKKNINPDDLKKAGGAEGIDKLINGQLDQIRDEVAGAEKVKRLTDQQNQIKGSVESVNNSLKEGQAAVRQYAAEYGNLFDRIKQAGDGLKLYFGEDSIRALTNKKIFKPDAERTGVDALPFGQHFKAAGDFLSNQVGLPSVTGDNANRMETAKHEIDSILNEAKTIKELAAKGGGEAIPPERITNLMSRLKASLKKAQDLAVEIQGSDQVGIGGAPAGTALPDINDIIKGIEDDLIKTTNNHNKAGQQYGSVTERIKALSYDTSSVNDNVAKLGPIAAAAGGTVVPAFESIAKAADDAEAKARALIQTMQKALLLQGQKLDLPVAPGTLPPVPDLPGEAPKQMTGGLLYAAGGPVGSDMQNVYAQAGEFIWNRGATSQFYSQIAAVNMRGRTPTSFTQTSGDTINVGGINVSGNNQPEATANQVYNLMRRARRRGIA